ncbi:TPA: hypothetical protein ACFRHE_001463 [Neisseria lactamica]
MFRNGCRVLSAGCWRNRWDWWSWWAEAHPTSRHNLPYIPPRKPPYASASRVRNGGRERRTGIAGIFCVSIIILFLMRYSKNMMPSGSIAPYPRAPEQDCMADA